MPNGVYYLAGANGRYLGVFRDEYVPPEGTIKLDVEPTDPDHWWLFGKWQLPKERALEIVEPKIDAMFKAKLEEGFAYAGKVLQIREQDQVNVSALGQEARWAKLLQVPWPANFAWRCIDDSFLPVGAADAMIALGEAVKAEVYRLRLVKWQHVDAVRALEQGDDILAYDFTTGWSL